jgi:hypothetical protein
MNALKRFAPESDGIAHAPIRILTGNDQRRSRQ